VRKWIGIFLEVFWDVVWVTVDNDKYYLIANIFAFFWYLQTKKTSRKF
jgi:hypothetical protein